MSTVVCWFQRTLKQLEREQTDTQTDRQTDRQDDYSNPRACAPRVNKLNLKSLSEMVLMWGIGSCVSRCVECQRIFRGCMKGCRKNDSC